MGADPPMIHLAGCAKSDYAHEGICRDKRDAPRIVQPDGKVRSYSRISSYGKVLEDLNALMDWKCRMTAIGLSLRPDLMASVAAFRDDKEKLKPIVAAALEAGGATQQATRGTAVHALTESVDKKLPIGAVPEEIAFDLLAYEVESMDLGVEHLLIEAFVVLDELKVAGTFDRVIRLNGKNYIADLKTSSSADYPHAWAIQMALYSRASLYDINTHERTPLPDVDQDRAVLIHLPAGMGRCEFKWIDIAAGWDMAIRGVPMVKEWRARKDLLTPVVIERENA